jgi:hypothetical protein
LVEESDFGNQPGKQYKVNYKKKVIQTGLVLLCKIEIITVIAGTKLTSCVQPLASGM